MAPSRRDALQSVATSLLVLSTAGCSAFGGNTRGVTDVIVQNRTATSQTVSITVTYDDGETAIEETLTVAPDDDVVINNEVVMETDTTVDVQVNGGPTDTYEWTASVEALYVTITEDDITFEKKA